MNNYTEYDDSASTLRYKFLAVLFLATLVLLFVFGFEAVLYLFLPIYFVLMLKPWRYRIKEVVVVDHILTVTRSNIFTGKSSFSFDTDRVDFIYRNRPVKFGDGKRGNVLTLFFDEHFLFDLTPDEEGWRDQSIIEVVRYLKGNGIKQMIGKYGEKDIVI